MLLNSDSVNCVGDQSKILGLNIKARHILSASTIALTFTLAVPAAAQLPPECDPQFPTAGQTVQCDGVINSDIGVFVDDLTVVIGSNGAPATVNGLSQGVFVSANNPTINVVDSDTTLTGGLDGILVFTNDGDVNVSSEGALLGINRTGIASLNFGSGSTNIEVVDAIATNPSPYGFSTGIYAFGQGGDINITSTGTARGAFGILVRNFGTGDTNIEANIVDGVYRQGIYARTGSGSGNLNISATGPVSGVFDGINAISSGEGNVNVNVVDVTGRYSGIRAGIYSNTGGSLSVTSSGTVYGRYAGISATSFAAGSTTVNAVNVGALYGTAINVYGSRYGTDVSVTATGDVTSDASGISVTNRGSGTTTINVATVTSDFSNGIVAYGGYNTTDLSVTATGPINAGDDGISVFQNGYGAVNVTSNIINSNYGRGINVSGGRNVSEISIQSQDAITSSSTGINVTTSGGSTTIEATDITSVNSEGIYVRHFGSYYYGGYTASNTTDIDITVTGDVNADSTGIRTRNLGAGSTTISSNNVTARFDGVYAYGGVDSTDISISSTGDVSTVYGNGITAFSSGSGNVDISSTGSVTSSYSAGIVAVGRDATTGITISSSGPVTAGYSGVIAVNQGSGDINITTSDIAARYGSGINAYGDNSSGDLTITSNGNVTSEFTDGILARSDSDGNISITTLGEVSGGFTGIRAIQSSGTVTIDTSNDVSGDSTGILVAHFGTDTSTINVNGNVTGGDGAGIQTSSNSGAFIINLNDGANVRASSGIAITDNAGDTTVTMADGSSVTGQVLLGDGSDQITISAGADISGVVLLDGGDDISGTDGQVDTIDLAGASIDGSILANWENVVFSSGANAISGELTAGLLNVGAGSSLDAANGSFVSNDLLNNGTLTIAGSGTGDLDVGEDFTQSADGSLILDVNSATDHDQLNVGGTASLDGTLTVNQSEFVIGTVTLIDARSLDGQFAVENIGDSGLLLVNEIEYDYGAGDVNLVGTAVDASNVAGLTPNQIAVANSLIGDFIGGSTDTGLSSIALSAGTLSDPATLAKTLEELHPEELIAGLQTFQNSQMLFGNALMGQTMGAEQCASWQNDASINRENCEADRFWGSVQYMTQEQNGTFSGVDFDTDGFEISAGVANVGDGRIRFGVGVGYAELESEMGGDGLDEVKTQMFRLGAHARADFNKSDQGFLAHADVMAGYGTGKNEIVRRVNAPAIGLAENQSADPNISGMNGLIRFSFDGVNGNYWPISPFVQFSADKMSQDSVRLGAGSAALDIDDIDASRTTLGAGLKFSQALGESGFFRLTGTALRHSGDTDTAFSSRFVSSSSGNSFTTFGEDVETQYIIDLGVGLNIGTGMEMRLDGFGEFGDLEGYGGRVTIAKLF